MRRRVCQFFRLCCMEWNGGAGGAFTWAAWRCSSTLYRRWRCVQAHGWVPVGVREVQSLLGLAVAGLFFLVWWFYDAISLGLFALPATFFLVFVPSLGPDRYMFPSQGVRVSWLIAHIAALLLAYVALGFSLLASILYLVQERRIKSKLKAVPGQDPGGRRSIGCRRWIRWSGWLRRCWSSAFPA